MEEKIFCTVKKTSAYRKRYDSEMNFDQYVDLYQVPPNPPCLKPLVEPDDDLPPFELQQSTIQDKDEVNQNGSPQKKIIYKLDSIPQVEDSQNNSMMFTSPKKNTFQSFIHERESKEVSEKSQIEKPKVLARRRRCQSQTQDYQILTFLNESCRGKKKVKKQ